MELPDIEEFLESVFERQDPPLSSLMKNSWREMVIQNRIVTPVQTHCAAKLPRLDIRLSKVVVEKPSGDCYDFGNHDDLSICEHMHEEIMMLGNISEASSKDLEGEEIIVLCNYIAKFDLLEFYFKHGEDMSSVVGVGLDYSKAILIEGWRVKVEEILEEDWVQAWKKVESGSTAMPKLLRVESDALIKSEKEVFAGKEVLKPLLWDLAKYFTLNGSIDLLVKSTTTSSSHGSNSRGSTSKGSSSNPQGSYGNNNRGGFQEAVPKWFKKQGGKNGEDNNDDEENDNKGKAPDPNPSDANENDLNWSKVFVDLLPGGDIFEKSKFSQREKEKLRTLDGTISPHLEFTFEKKSENKEIEVIVGNVQFNLGFVQHGGSDQVKWIHDDMGISFGLQGNNQAFGELVRNSFKHFDIVNTRKETVSESHTNEKRKGKDITVGGGFCATVHGVGPAANIGRTHSKSDANSQQHERSSETSCDILEGGMKLRQTRDPKERQIRCEYFFPREKDSSVNLSASPMSFIQDIRFQATWRPLDVKPNGISRDSVIYTLEVDRNLEEVVGETTNSEEFVKVNVNASEAEIPQQGGPMKYIRQLINRGRKSNAIQKASTTSESDTSQHGGSIKCKQIYRKTLYINHAMTNLDSKTHELKEQEGVTENSEKYQYFCSLKNRKFFQNGSPKPYVWINGALVKLEEDSERSRVATTSATAPALPLTNLQNGDVASTSATTPALLVRNPQNKDVSSTCATLASSLTCDLCKKPTEQRWPCSKCQMMNYCTRSCKVMHWIDGHKSECRPVDPNASRGAM